MNVTLVAFKPDGTRVDFRVKGGKCVVGRDTAADLRIPVGIVSRHHCEFRVEDDEVVLRDLGSSNGTFLNGKRVTEATLGAGDLVRVGPTTFTVVVDGIPDVVTPPDEGEGVGSDGSSMMDQPVRASAPAAAAVGAGKPKAPAAPVRADDNDDDDDDDRSSGSGGFEDPLSKMIERQDDDDDDFDFDFFTSDEDDDDLR